ncbi:hypothetical protein ACSSK6_22930 [Escherichia coli]|uniref:hypothetical protein n=1 Tax=Escherichia coli TaxID=562 RepID=UPI001C7996C6|nr:hypothetical protein KRX18_23805 [Escherichia coli]
MIALSIIRLLHYMEQTPDTYSYTACHIGCSSVLVEDSSTPARATNSGLENTKKPDNQSGFFVPVVRLFFRFFPSFGGFFFHFLLRPILLFALANCVMALLTFKSIVRNNTVQNIYIRACTEVSLTINEHLDQNLLAEIIGKIRK